MPGELPCSPLSQISGMLKPGKTTSGVGLGQLVSQRVVIENKKEGISTAVPKSKNTN